MSINAATSAVTQAASGYISKTATGQATPASALAEASETPATTAKEAGKGDKVAQRLLAKEAEAKKQQESPPASEPGKGELVDRTA